MPNDPNTPADDLLARVVDLVALIDYQEAAVVSRTLIKRATGTVTLFAFDRGQELSEHTAPFDALVQLLEGEAEITIAGKPMRLTPGQMLVMPASLKLNTKSVRKALSKQRLRFATREELKELTGLEPGCVPPFGSLFGLQTWCDTELRIQPRINFSAGDHTLTLE